MAKRDPHDETIDALEYLADQRSNAGDEETYSLSSAPEPPPPPPANNLPPLGPASSADSFSQRASDPRTRPSRRARAADADDADYRCLRCAYLLNARSGYRCSECGATHSMTLLDRWFSGEEAARVERIIWLIVALLFAKLWFWLPGISAIGKIAASVAAGYGCWLTAEGKTESNAGMFGMAGAVVSLLLGCLLFGNGGEYYYVVDMTVAGLLLAGIVSDPDFRTILATYGVKKLGLIIVFVAPAVGATFYGLDFLAQKAPTVALLAFQKYSLTWFAAIAMNLVAWGLVLWNVRFVQKTLYGGVEEAM
ncbi:MAG: hypothetical protein AB7N71_11595 [Phycisphaerae bacterium]